MAAAESRLGDLLRAAVTARANNRPVFSDPVIQYDVER
jgi:hypothetical protein